nr:hypothetical protein GCM10020063_006450 [Dactylosporangium thailandense]
MIRGGRTLAGHDLLGGYMRRLVLALLTAGVVVLGGATAAHAINKQGCYTNAGEWQDKCPVAPPSPTATPTP